MGSPAPPAAFSAFQILAAILQSLYEWTAADSGVSLPVTYLSALTARRRLPTVDPIRLASPDVRRDLPPLSTVTFSGVFSVEISGMDDSLRVPRPKRRPKPSRGVTGAEVPFAILLAGEPLTLRDTSPDARAVTEGEVCESSGSSKAVDIGRLLL